MTNESDFDAEDLVNAILGLDSTAASSTSTPTIVPARTTNTAGAHLGWVLLAALILALSVAVSLAIQIDSDASPNPSRCGGLYSQCCDDWDDNWGDCPDDRDRNDCARFYADDPTSSQRGLFDSEERFVDDC